MSRARERGGTLSLLLTLLAVGALLYFGLRGIGGSGNHEGVAVNCTQLAQALIAKTGGLGPDYETGYARLPESCRKFLPPPGALTPSPERATPET